MTSRGEHNKGVAQRFHARGWVPVQFAASGFRRVARRSPPEAGFSQSRRASPEAHQSRPNLPVSKCGFLLAFDKQTASSEPDTILRMKISKDVYVRYRSQQEHLWTPEAESSPKVMHWPWRMSERGDFPPVAGQYFINSVALSIGFFNDVIIIKVPS